MPKLLFSDRKPVDSELIGSFPCVTLGKGIETDEVYNEHCCNSCEYPASSPAVSFCTQCDTRMCAEHEQVGSIQVIVSGW